MVNDKFQARTTGPVVSTTGQPIKGRSKGGGIRVGEMERDSLLAHGTAFLLQDRLMNCSDYTKAAICRTCGSFLTSSKADLWMDAQGLRYSGGEDVAVVAVPGVLKFLDIELASMGVRLKFNVGP